MNILFLFFDGVGLGENDPTKNPFVTTISPTFDSLLSGRKLISMTTPFTSRYCSLLSIDAHMGTTGLPQSATGQATLLTGLNFPKILGYHYGPKPNPEMAAYFEEEGIDGFPSNIDNNNLSIFSQLSKSGKKACLLNAYPPSYFEAVNSKKRNHSLIPLAVTSSGIRLFDQNDFMTGKALSADFTGQGWRDHLKILDTPVISPVDAGKLLANLSKDYHFSLFEFWETDLIGHKQDFNRARRVIEKIDLVMEGLISNWDFEKDGILITSDHGNMEDLSTRRHTNNQVPAMFIGPPAIHQSFFENIKSIGDIAPFILHLLNN